jgi:hypothetical protein
VAGKVQGTGLKLTESIVWPGTEPVVFVVSIEIDLVLLAIKLSETKLIEFMFNSVKSLLTIVNMPFSTPVICSLILVNLGGLEVPQPVIPGKFVQLNPSAVRPTF